MALYLSSSLGTRNLQPWVGFGSSLSHSRLDASGSAAHAALGDQREQPPAILRGREASRDPLRPQLHSVLEAQLTRAHAGVAGGLRHESSSFWTSCVTASSAIRACRSTSSCGTIESAPRHSRTTTLTRTTCRSDRRHADRQCCRSRHQHHIP